MVNTNCTVLRKKIVIHCHLLFDVDCRDNLNCCRSSFVFLPQKKNFDASGRSFKFPYEFMQGHFLAGRNIHLGDINRTDRHSLPSKRDWQGQKTYAKRPVLSFKNSFLIIKNSQSWYFANKGGWLISLVTQTTAHKIPNRTRRKVGKSRKTLPSRVCCCCWQEICDSSAMKFHPHRRKCIHH